MVRRNARQSFSQAIAAVATLLAMPLPGLFLGQPTDILQRSVSALEAWQSETSTALERFLKEAPAARLMTPNSAVVRVLFSIGDDGRADDIELLDGDGNWSARRAALYAVRRLDTLQRVPVADPGNVRFLAYLVFYRSEEARDRLVTTIRSWERRRLALSGPAREYLTIGNV